MYDKKPNNHLALPVFAVLYAMGKCCYTYVHLCKGGHTHSRLTFMHGEAEFLLFNSHPDFKFSG